MRYYLSLLPGEPEKQGDPLFRKLNGTQAHGTCAHLIERVCQALGFPRLLPRGARKSQVSQVSVTCLSTHCFALVDAVCYRSHLKIEPTIQKPGDILSRRLKNRTEL
jgi:hypothetical protein